MSCIICSSPVDIILDLGEQSLLMHCLLHMMHLTKISIRTFSLYKVCSSTNLISCRSKPAFFDIPLGYRNKPCSTTFSNVLCQEILDRHYQNTKERPLVVEVASNDGTFLSHFEKIVRSLVLNLQKILPKSPQRKIFALR